jgi:cellulose synthase/poly-beta-1,6-N-acetylglucosamine synthase-like glycosyltransferase
MIEIVLFWIPILLLFHSYLLFPVAIHLLAKKKKNNKIVYNQTDPLPCVSIVLSVYNEENVINQRVHNIFQTIYPPDKFELLIGSDGSTDKTNDLLRKLQEEYPAARIFLFNERQGKGNVLNQLTKEARGEILLLTDAKVQFTTQTIFQLVKHFKNQEIGIIGGNVINNDYSKDGISIQEKWYMSHEIVIKYNEGRLWGTIMGAYGACYAIRHDLFEPIPEGFAVDDFYVTVRALEKKFKSILEIDAVCYEDVPNRIEEEFRRKVRISCGNFQNLGVFIHLLWKVNPLSFCFFSHKVIRWIGPFLLLSTFVSNIFIIDNSPIYVYTLIIQLSLLFILIIDFFLHKIHLQIITLRFVTHFYSMNLALLFGFIKYLKGVKTNVWEPTTRTYKKTEHH